MGNIRVAIAAALVIASVPARGDVPFSEPLVSLTFDDNVLSQYQTVRPELNRRGFKGTFYIISTYLEWGDGVDTVMNVAQVRQLAAEGHEIASHSETHPDLTQIGDAQLHDELGGSQSQLAQLIGLPDVTDFSFPYGAWDQRAIDAGKQYYLSMRTTDDQLNYRDTDPYRLQSMSGNVPANGADVKERIDEAIQKNGWLTIFFHNVTSHPDPNGGYDFSYADFVDVLDYLVAHDVKVITVAQGIARMNGHPPPSLTGTSPASGPTVGGTSVTLTGTHFSVDATVTFGGTGAPVTSNDRTQLVVTAPAHAAGRVDVTVTNADGQSSTLSNGYTYQGSAPTLTSLSPTSGSTAGGTSVTLTGTNFLSGATVSFGGTPATVGAVTSSSIQLTTLAHAAGTVNVVVTNPDGRSATLTAAYTYVSPQPAPALASLSPTGGPIAGGTPVTLAGANFVAGATVTFGGAGATVGLVTSTAIQVTAPQHAMGSVDVEVTNPDGQSATLTRGYLYVGPVPTLTSASPGRGSTAGGTSVTLTGANFASGATVTFGGTPATVGTITATTIQVATPAHADGAVDVVVTNPDQQSATLAGGYTYASPPTLTSVNPTSGPIAGGTSVTLTGASFDSGATVTFGGTPATVGTVTATTIQVTTPAHAQGPVGVVVTNPDQQSATSAGGFTYLGTAPTLTSVSPASGSTAGGTAVTLTGANFASGATVTFGGSAATVTSLSATSIQATAPAHGAGVVEVQVRNPDGQSGTLSGGYTYATPTSPPSIASITPASGGTSGGTAVTIAGGSPLTLVNTPTSNRCSAHAASCTIGGLPQIAAGALVVVLTGTSQAGGTVALPTASGLTFASRISHAVSNGGVGIATAVAGGTIAAGSSITIRGTNGASSVAGMAFLFTGASTSDFGTPVAADDANVGGVASFSAPLSATAAGSYVLGVANNWDRVTATAGAGVTALWSVVDSSDGGYWFAQRTAVTSAPGSAPISGRWQQGTPGTVDPWNVAAIEVKAASGGGGGSFVSGATVTFGGSDAPVVSLTSSSIQVTTPAHAVGAVDVVVRNPDGQTATRAGGFAYVQDPPTLASVSPASGPIAGGTPVALAGANFLAGATVTFGGSPAAVGQVTPTTIAVTAPQHPAGKVEVRVTNPDGQTAALGNAYTYVGPVPTLTSVSPARGSTAGGTSVTLTGASFASGATVTFGGTPATVGTVTATTIQVITPAHAAATVDVVVTNPDAQSATLAGGYTYASPPTLSSVSPTSGPIAGGTSVALNGTGFVAGATVTFGGTPATVETVTPSAIQVTTAAHAAGAVDVVVTNPDAQSATLAGGYAYLGPAPTLVSVSPASGSTAGGTLVTLSGTGFVAGATVAFGGTPATVGTVAPTTIQVTTPAHAAGAVDVVVRNPDAQSATLAAGYTYAAPAETFTVVPLSSFTATRVTVGAAATFYGRTARPVTVTQTSGNHRLANSSSSRASGTWEITVLAHADVGRQVELQLDNGGSTIKRGQFDLVGGLVHATSGSGVTASVDDLGNGWYRCRLRVRVRPQNAYVAILNGSWARSYTGDGRRDVQVAEVTIDQR